MSTDPTLERDDDWVGEWDVEVIPDDVPGLEDYSSNTHRRVFIDVGDDGELTLFRSGAPFVTNKEEPTWREIHGDIRLIALMGERTLGATIREVARFMPEGPTTFDFPSTVFQVTVEGGRYRVLVRPAQSRQGQVESDESWVKFSQIQKIVADLDGRAL